jgi:hypothetical protein
MKLLQWLRNKLSNYTEDGLGGMVADNVITRFAELIKLQESFKETQQHLLRAVDALETAQKMAMSQLQFAQSVVHQLERRATPEDVSSEQLEQRNGADEDNDLHGK